MITRLMISVGDPDVVDGVLVVAWVACGVTAAGVKGKLGGSVPYTFGATVAQKQTALLNSVKAEIPGQFPGASFSSSLLVEYLGI